MNKKILFISVGAIAIVIVGIVLFRNSQYASKSLVKINTSTNSSPQSISSQTVQEYVDSAGFKFSYPESVSISPINTTDASVYSSLVATSSSTPGKITVEAVSSDLTTLDDMLKSKTDVTDVKLADLAAKRYTEKGNVITLALDKGVLFTFTASSGGNVSYWNEVNDKIIASFAFVAPTAAQVQPDTSAPTTDSDVTFDGEETIE